MKSWNYYRGAASGDQQQRDRPRLRSNDDVSIGDPIVTALKLCVKQRHPGVFTRFYTSFVCDGCQADHINLEEWEERPFASTPILSVPEDRRNLSPPMLLTDMLKSTFRYCTFENLCYPIRCHIGITILQPLTVG